MIKIYFVKITSTDKGNFHFVFPELDEQFNNFCNEYAIINEKTLYSVKLITELKENEINILKNNLMENWKNGKN